MMPEQKTRQLDVDRKYLLRTLEEIAEAFRLDFPERYEEHSRYIRQARDGLLRGSGASPSGMISWRMSLPQELMQFIDYTLRKRGIIPEDESFFWRWDNVELLLRAWPEWRVGT